MNGLDIFMKYFLRKNKTYVRLLGVLINEE